jgi:hypothetical protein
LSTPLRLEHVAGKLLRRLPVEDVAVHVADVAARL